jgi:hypothetical protein
MAFTLSTENRGFTFANAHYEIIGISANRATRLVTVEYLVFVNRASALNNFAANALFGGTATIPFADVGAQLTALKNACEANLMARFPAATTATDAG